MKTRTWCARGRESEREFLCCWCRDGVCVLWVVVRGSRTARRDAPEAGGIPWFPLSCISMQTRLPGNRLRTATERFTTKSVYDSGPYEGEGFRWWRISPFLMILQRSVRFKRSVREIVPPEPWAPQPLSPTFFAHKVKLIMDWISLEGTWDNLKPGQHPRASSNVVIETTSIPLQDSTRSLC